MRARYYDPATAQFLNRDPVTKVTQQPYAYAYNNPLNVVDPSGLYGYKYSYDLGQPPFSPEQLNAEVVSHFSDYFPFAGCGPGLYVGKECSLGFGRKDNPIRVTSITARSFTSARSRAILKGRTSSSR